MLTTRKRKGDYIFRFSVLFILFHLLLSLLFYIRICRYPVFNSVLHELKQIEKNSTFNVEKFAEFAKYHQGMLYPAFQLQYMLQGKILGHKFWTKCSNRRIELAKGKYIALKDLMELVSFTSASFLLSSMSPFFLLQHLHKDLEQKVMNSLPAAQNKNQQQVRDKAAVAMTNTGSAASRSSTDYSNLGSASKSGK
jgi:hypothetical protein